MADEKPLGEKCPCCEKPFRTEGRWEPGVCCKREFPEGSIAGCYDDGRQLALKRLAAAEAMVEAFQSLKRAWYDNNIGQAEFLEFCEDFDWNEPPAPPCPLYDDGDPASRPSEQAHDWCECSGEPPCPAGKCPATNRRLASEQASKEDSASDQDVGSAAWGEAWMRRCRVAESRVQELEASLLHQEKVSETYLITIHSLGDERDELKAKLEVAEAERAHLLEADQFLTTHAKLIIDALFAACRNRSEDRLGEHLQATSGLAIMMQRRDRARVQSRAAAVTEEPKPEPALCIHCLKPVHEGRCGLPNPVAELRAILVREHQAALAVLDKLERKNP